MVIQVKVHESVAALRGAAKRFDQRTYGKSEGDFSDTLGICHRFHLMNEDLIAIVRLAPPHIGAGMVSHELAHAAVWMWEIQNKFSKKHPLHCANDEWFCWVLGELVRCTINQFNEKGVYTK